MRDDETPRQRRHRLALQVHDFEWQQMHAAKLARGPHSVEYRSARAVMLRAWDHVKEAVR